MSLNFFRYGHFKNIIIYLLFIYYIHNIAVRGDVRQGAVAFHKQSQHLIVCSRNPGNEQRGQVSIYTNEGEFVLSIQLDTEKEPVFAGLAVSPTGRIALANVLEGKIHVL